MGCDYAQGYFFARPLRPDTMIERIAGGLAIPNSAARQQVQPHLVAVPDSLGA
jgi:EAL domain-containing protein (putative c-di-GMP-specific phosphodiesterase class I)